MDNNINGIGSQLLNSLNETKNNDAISILDICLKHLVPHNHYNIYLNTSPSSNKKTNLILETNQSTGSGDNINENSNKVIGNNNISHTINNLINQVANEINQNKTSGTINNSGIPINYEVVINNNENNENNEKDD